MLTCPGPECVEADIVDFAISCCWNLLVFRLNQSHRLGQRDKVSAFSDGFINARTNPVDISRDITRRGILDTGNA